MKGGSMAIEFLDRTKSLSKEQLVKYELELQKALKANGEVTKAELIFSREHGNHEKMLEKCEIIVHGPHTNIYTEAKDWSAEKSYRKALGKLKRLIREKKEKVISKKRAV